MCSCIQQERFATAALGEFDGTLDALIEGGSRRQRPYGLGERDCACSSQLAPDRYAMARWLGRHLHGKNGPTTVLSGFCHDLECSARYSWWVRPVRES